MDVEFVLFTLTDHALDLYGRARESLNILLVPEASDYVQNSLFLSSVQTRKQRIRF